MMRTCIGFLLLGFGQLLQAVQHLAHNLLLDDLQRGMRLQRLARHAQRQCVRVNDALQEAQVPVRRQSGLHQLVHLRNDPT